MSTPIPHPILIPEQTIATPTLVPLSVDEQATRTTHRADLFVQTMFEDIARFDQAYPSDLATRTKAISNEINELMNETFREMKHPDIPAHFYNPLAIKMARVIQNLLQHWTFIDHRIEECAKVTLEHKELEARAEALYKIYFDLKWDDLRKNGFQCADKVAKVKELLEDLRDDVETEPSVLHDQARELSTTALGLIITWITLIARLKTLQEDADRSENAVVSGALKMFFRYVDSATTKEQGSEIERAPVVSPVEKRHLLSWMVDVIFCASCLILVSIVIEFITPRPFQYFPFVYNCS
jgi:hypothetical protein